MQLFSGEGRQTFSAVDIVKIVAHRRKFKATGVHLLNFFDTFGRDAVHFKLNAVGFSVGLHRLERADKIALSGGIEIMHACRAAAGKHEVIKARDAHGVSSRPVEQV
ncbi:hypothetical protein SDC9_133686 [bioreactor metagenome]|uniref:Uncharacterized protein n=1 Tax=bioreactor metagenome TaxID=1076179 RepID=A0A645DAY9_9ZZZZ